MKTFFLFDENLLFLRRKHSLSFDHTSSFSLNHASTTIEMANLFPPLFLLPPLRQPYTSSCDCSMNICNAREELHNVVGVVYRTLTTIHLDIVKFVASIFFCFPLYLFLSFADETHRRYVTISFGTMSKRNLLHR